MLSGAPGKGEGLGVGAVLQVVGQVLQLPLGSGAGLEALPSMADHLHTHAGCGFG